MVKRYDFDYDGGDTLGVHQRHDGDYVEFDDYDALAAEVAMLKAQLAEVTAQRDAAEANLARLQERWDARPATDELEARLAEAETALHHYSGGTSEYFERYGQPTNNILRCPAVPRRPADPEIPRVPLPPAPDSAASQPSVARCSNCGGSGIIRWQAYDGTEEGHEEQDPCPVCTADNGGAG